MRWKSSQPALAKPVTPDGARLMPAPPRWKLVGASRVLRRTELLRQLRKYRARAAYRGEEQRRARLVAELRTARLTGIRVAGDLADFEHDAAELARAAGGASGDAPSGGPGGRSPRAGMLRRPPRIAGSVECPNRSSRRDRSHVHRRRRTR